MKTTDHSRRKFIRHVSLSGLAMGFGAEVFSSVKRPAQKKIGIIGLDNSHSIAFAKTLNADDAGSEYKNYKVTCDYPKGSDTIETSAQRIKENTVAIQKYGVRIASSIESILQEADAVMIETNDGHLHIEQALPVFKTRKPVFIDKPLAASFLSVSEIFQQAKKYNCPLFSASSLRYVKSIQDIVAGSAGKVLGADVFSPAPLEKSHPDLFWYGIHGVEMLYTVMGTGCKSVTRVHTADTDTVTGVWNDERIGVVRGTRTGKAAYGGMVFGDSANIPIGPFEGYGALLVQIIDFFETRISPVPFSETIEIYAFMEAADQSKRQDGKTVLIETIMLESNNN